MFSRGQSLWQTIAGFCRCGQYGQGNTSEVEGSTGDWEEPLLLQESERGNMDEVLPSCTFYVIIRCLACH